MAKTRDTGFLVNVINVDQNGNVAIVSGSRTLLSVSSSGAVTTTGVISGSNALSASYSVSGSYAVSSSYAFTASSAINSFTASNANTASSADTFIVRNNLTGSNALFTGAITAQTLVVSTVSASVEYSSGSNIFGSSISNTQTFTGSIQTSGSAYFLGNLSVGTSSLSYPLTINANLTQTSIALMSGYSNSGARNWGIATNALSYGDLNVAQSNTQGADPFSGTSRLYFSNTGNVGIGNTGPDRKLYVADTSATQSTILGYNQCTTFCGTVIEAITDRTCNSAFNLMNLKASTTSMFIVKGDGSVGINCSSPSGKLQVANSSTQYALYTTTGNLELYTPEGNCGYVRLGSAYNLNGVYGSCGLNYIVTGTSAHAFRTTDNNCERLRIFSTGIVCFTCQICTPTINIGTTDGYTTATQGQFFSKGGGSMFTANLLSGGWGRHITLQRNDVTKFHIGLDGGDNYTILNSSDCYLMSIVSSGIACFSCQICVGGMVALTNSSFGGPATEAAFRIRLADNGGINNDPGIGLDGSGGGGEKMWFNALGGFYMNLGTNGAKFSMNSGGDVCFGSTVNNLSGTAYSNSVVTYSVGGTMAGQTATSFDFPVWNDNGVGQIFEIKAFFEHYFNWNYGTSLYKYMATRNTSTQDLTMFNCVTSNGGCWIAYKTSDTNLRVCKIAGGYPGSGAYWIQVTAKQP